MTSPARILLGDPDQIDLGIVGQFALVGHRDRDEGAAGKGQPAPFDHGARFGILQDRAVLEQPPRGQFLDHGGIAGPELDQVAVAADQHLRHAGGARQLGMLEQMQRLAMHRDQQLRPHPGDHVAQFVAARMAGDVDQMGAVGDDLDALRDQAVDDGADRLLVAGNGARGKDHAVALVQRDLRMIVIGDARQRRARLALAAGAQRQHLVGRKMPIEIGAAEILHAVEIAGLARHLHHALHRAPDHHHLAPGRLGGVRDRAQPRDVGGKGGHGDPALGGLHQFGDGLGDLGLRRRAPFPHRIGGIADQRQHAGIAEFAQPPLVGRHADDRRRIDFPVAGVQHGPDLGLDRQRMGFRNRMRDRNELDIERPELDPAARRHHRNRDFRRIALGGAFGLEQRRAEFGRIDRAFQFRPEVDDGAEMVLMGMGQHQADQIFAFLFQEADIGHDQIDAGQMLLVAKGNAEIDRQPAALMAVAEAVDRQVHADLADAAERRKGQFIRARHQAAPAEAAEPK